MNNTSITKGTGTRIIAAYAKIRQSMYSGGEFMFYDSPQSRQTYYERVVARIGNATLLKVYVDDNKGKIVKPMNRPGFGEMMYDAQNKKFQILMVRPKSEISGNIEETYEAVKELKSYGVEVVFEREGMSSNDEFTMGILKNLAKDRKARF